MHDDTFEENYDDLIEEPYTPPGIREIILKGLVITFGIIGFLGSVRWRESDYEPGYHVGMAGFAAMFCTLGVWDVMSGQWRRWRTVWLAAGVVVFALDAFGGPP